MNDHTSHTKNAGVLCGVVLHHAFKPVVLVVVLASVAQKKFFLVLFRQWLDLGIKDPFHILQDDFPFGGSIRRILSNRVTGCHCQSIFSFNVIIEPATHVQQYFSGKLGTFVFRDGFAAGPFVTSDNLVSVGSESIPNRLLDVFPFSVECLLGFLELGFLLTAFLGLGLEELILHQSFIFPALGYFSLSEQTWLQYFPVSLREHLRNLHGREE